MTRVKRAAADIFRSLRIRNFRLFFAGQLVSQIGTWLTTIAQTLLVLKLTNSGVAIGFLVACQFGPVLLLGAWAGAIADRSNKRRLLMTTQALEMLQSFGLAAIAFMPHPSLIGLDAVALAGGVMLAFDNPTRRSFVTEMVPVEYIQNAVTLNSALMTSARIVGPALAGLLVVTVGYGWCFVVDGVSYLAVLTGLWLMRPAELRATPRARREKGQVRAGIRYVRSVADLRIPIVMMIVLGTLTFNFAVVIPLFVTHSLHRDESTFTIFYSVMSVGSFVGALVAAKRHTLDVRDLVYGAAGFGAAMLILAAAPSLSFALPIALLVGFASVSFMTTSTALMQVRSDPAMIGRVLALQAIVLIGTTPLGGPLLGVVCDNLGARAGLVLGGVAALAAATWGFFAARGRVIENEQPGRAPAVPAGLLGGPRAGAGLSASAAQRPST